MIDVFQEIADPSRRRILSELLDGPRSVGQIVAATGFKQPNVSNHLAKLRQAGIVRTARDGRSIRYQVATPSILSTLNQILRATKVKTKKHSLNNGLAAKIARLGIGGNEVEIDEIVDSLLSDNVEIPKIYSKAFAPALALVGTWWEEGEINVGQEHMATAIIERQISKVMVDASPKPFPNRRAVLGCSEGNYHAIGVRMISDLMQVDGWQCLYMGQNVPNDSFLDAVREHKPPVVLISCGLEEHQEKAIELIESLHKLRQGKNSFLIVVGGYGVELDSQYYTDAGADLAATSIDDFLAIVLPTIRTHADRAKVSS